MDNPNLQLMEAELTATLQFRSAVMLAKGQLCDAQHAYQTAQEAVEQAQRSLAFATQRLNGVVMGLAASRGILSGEIDLTPDGKSLQVKTAG